ncbi:hypothetical protein BDY24DRAFT_392502 [Mrakia frigida]|uniref:SMP-30/gluconolactonase/LRE family protein n=1 Tax=Mrakia frigida TaxID=29902 RepID=UPI003FCBF245
MTSQSTKEETTIPSTVQLALPSTYAVLPPFNREIKGDKSHFHSTSHLASASSLPPPPPPLDPTKPFLVHHPHFLTLLGPKPTFSLLAEDRTGKAFAHEAPVYWKDTNEVIFSSSPYGKGYEVVEVISRVNVETGQVNGIPGSEQIITPNGAIRFGDKILFCSQGVGEDQPGGLATLDVATGEVKYLLNNFYGRRFNSPNDVAILPPPSWVDSSLTTASTESHATLGTTIFFTDPTYAYQQHFKPAPELPNQVWAFNAATGDVRAVADGFDMPNGICFNLEGTICYITDTGMVSETAEFKRHRPGTIYAYDVLQPSKGADLTLEGPTLVNRRVFCYTDGGIPDGVKCDTEGNVYTGCLDGLHIYHKSGTLVGRIVLFPDPASAFPTLSRHCANFCLVPGGIVMMAEDRIYKVTLASAVKGALL